MKRAYEAYEKAEPTSLLYYKKIAQLLRERNIPCVVYIPPLPAPVAAYHLARNASPNFKIWEREISSIFPNIVDLSLTPHGQLENFFRSDLEHIKPDASAKIINREVIPKCVQLSKSRAN
jgi:hypothetical protein